MGPELCRACPDNACEIVASKYCRQASAKAVHPLSGPCGTLYSERRRMAALVRNIFPAVRYSWITSESAQLGDLSALAFRQDYHVVHRAPLSSAQSANFVLGAAGKDGGDHFFYEVNFGYGIGINVPNRAGRYFGLQAGMTIGAGLSGISNVVPFAGQLPILAFLSWDSFVSGQLYARTSFVTSEARRHGSQHAPVGDELTIGVDLVFLPLGIDEYRSEVNHSDEGFWAGYLVGLVYHEWMGAQELGVTLGFAIPAL